MLQVGLIELTPAGDTHGVCSGEARQRHSSGSLERRADNMRKEHVRIASAPYELLPSSFHATSCSLQGTMTVDDCLVVKTTKRQVVLVRYPHATDYLDGSGSAPGRIGDRQLPLDRSVATPRNAIKSPFAIPGLSPRRPPGVVPADIDTVRRDMSLSRPSASFDSSPVIGFGPSATVMIRAVHPLVNEVQARGQP
jgi:hypothetical protein